jgi:hypothetical protein
MECMEPCIRKGCMEDPWPIERMWLDTKVQPITGLQERIKSGETNRNGGSSTDPVLALPAPDAIIVHPASPTAVTASPTAASSPAASTAQTQAAPVARLDFSSLLPLPAKERKAQREKVKYEENMMMAVTVARSELDTIKTKVLYRIARHLAVNVNRRNRSWDDIRNDVRDVWPDACDSIELPGS